MMVILQKKFHRLKLANFLNMPVDQLFEYQGVDHISNK